MWHIAAIGEKNRQVCPHQSVAKIVCDFRWRSNSPQSAYKIAKCVAGLSLSLAGTRPRSLQRWLNQLKTALKVLAAFLEKIKLKKECTFYAYLTRALYLLTLAYTRRTNSNGIKSAQNSKQTIGNTPLKQDMSFLLLKNFPVFVPPKPDRKYSHTNSYICAVTAISEDDHRLQLELGPPVCTTA